MPRNRRVIDDALYVHFVTFSVYRRRRLLDHDHVKRIVLGTLNLVLERTCARCIGFVLMPDHVHAGWPGHDSLKGKMLRCAYDTDFLTEVLHLQRN